MIKKKFKFLEHTADVKFQVFGKTLEEIFENSSLALINIIYSKKIKKKKNFKINVTGKDFESLLYNFLEEFLFLFDSENFLASKIKNIKIIKNKNKIKLSADIFGDDAKNYEIEMSVKAITYNEMFIKKENKKWLAQVVLDI